MDEGRLNAWTEQEVAERLKHLFEEPSAPPTSPLTDAAAVLATFDLELIRPLGGPVPDLRLARAELAAQSTLTRNEHGEVCWQLQREPRRQAIRRLVREQRLEAAFAANPDRPAGHLQQALEDVLLKRPPSPESRPVVSDLRARLIVLDWLHGVVPGLPAPKAIRDEIERAALLEPFRDLVGDYFAGRQRELAALADYADILTASSALESARRLLRSVLSIAKEPPLFVYGPGGIGKSTLIAKFILDHVDNPAVPQFPFAYLDLDRPGLVAEEPITLLIEATRQLAVQYPSARHRLESLQREWTKHIVESAPAPTRTPSRREPRTSISAENSDDTEKILPVMPESGATRAAPIQPSNHILWSSLRLKDRDYYIETFAEAVRSLQSGEQSALLSNSMSADAHAIWWSLQAAEQPMLLVLDTFEQVQVRSAALVGEVFSFLDQLQSRLPFLRTVLSGRVATAPKGFAVKDLALKTFDLEAATAYLTQRTRVDAATAEAVARQVTGSPLTLKLAADLLNIEGADKQGLTGALAKGCVEAQLYSRVLGHIADPDVRKLAHPGLVLRRITPAIIKDVLAEPCGLVVPDLAHAQRLFDKLRRQVALVTDLGNDVVVHRPDLRAVMLDALRHDSWERVVRIHQRAIEYYTAHGSDAGSRAEEIYHRLSLEYDRTFLAARWQDGVGTYLAMSVAELPWRSQAFIAARSKLALAPEIWAEADIQDWELYAIREIGESLRVNRVDDALALLRSRTGWSSLELRTLHVAALARAGFVDEAKALLVQLLPLVAGSAPLQELLAPLATMLDHDPRMALPMRLASPDIRAVAEATQDAFSDLETLAEALDRFGLNDIRRRLPAPARTFHGRELAVQAAALANTAAQENRVAELLLALRRARPENLRLWRIAQRLGLTAHGYSTSDEEGFANAMAIQRRPGDLRQRLTQLEAQTCRVHVGERHQTGFLVGPDLVLTSTHAFVARHSSSPDFGAPITVVFDHWTTGTSVTMPGVTCNVVPKGALSPWTMGNPSLPFVLLRLDRAIGKLPGADEGERGWMTLPTVLEREPHTLVATLRFDGRQCLVFSYSPTGMRGFDDEQRLEYEIETDATTAGAPIFDRQLRPAALHFGAHGRSWVPRLRSWRLVRGVPLDAIGQSLRELGVVLPRRRSYGSM